MAGQITVAVDPDVAKVYRLISESERCKPDLSVNSRLPVATIMPGEGWTRAGNSQA